MMMMMMMTMIVKRVLPIAAGAIDDLLLLCYLICRCKINSRHPAVSVKTVVPFTPLSRLVATPLDVTGLRHQTKHMPYVTSVPENLILSGFLFSVSPLL